MIAVSVSRATSDDLPAILALHRELAGTRQEVEPADGSSAARIFAEVASDPHRYLMVASIEEAVVGTADAVFVPNLTYGGKPWAIVENVVVAAEHRRKGVGRALMRHLIDRGWELGCYKIQLLTGSKQPGTLA